MTKITALARIARRDLLRFKLRSLLIVVMIALPVAGMVGSIVYARTIKVEPAQQRHFLWGAADGMILPQGSSTKAPPVPAGVRLVGNSISRSVSHVTTDKSRSSTRTTPISAIRSTPAS